MEILTMKSTLGKGKYMNQSVADLVKIDGQIFSMIKEGYVFDDEVLAAAHVKKSIRNVKVYNRIGGDNVQNQKVLPKETASMKQILSEINNLGSFEYDEEKENVDKYARTYENEIDTITIDNLDN